MAKYYGAVGYAVTKETSPGVWEEDVTERMYYGDILRNNRKLNSADKINDDISISNEISIVADPYAMENFHAMRYVEFMGTRWKIANVDVQFPRLVLSLGGIYNGEN